LIPLNKTRRAVGLARLVLLLLHPFCARIDLP
jgi:hypothetical protein